MQMVVPTYLEQTMQAFTSQQGQMREQMTKAFGDNPMARNMQIPMQMAEEQVRRNTEIFQQAMRMFSPFKRHGEGSERRRRTQEDRRQS